MRLLLVSALLLLSACTELRPVDDRLSYEPQKRIEQRVEQEPAFGAFSYVPNIGWVRLSLALDTILPDGRVVTATYQDEENVASGAMILDPQNDRALVVVLERIRSRYILASPHAKGPR